MSDDLTPVQKVLVALYEASRMEGFEELQFVRNDEGRTTEQSASFAATVNGERVTVNVKAGGPPFKA